MSISVDDREEEEENKEEDIRAGTIDLKMILFWVGPRSPKDETDEKPERFNKTVANAPRFMRPLHLIVVSDALRDSGEHYISSLPSSVLSATASLH